MHFEVWLERVEGKLDRLDEKLDQMSARIGAIEITAQKHQLVLEDHTRRSLANEKAVEVLRKSLERRHRVAWPWGRIVAGLAALAGAIATAVKTWGRV